VIFLFMASYTTLKFVNSALWLTSSLIGWSRWLVFGNPESNEEKLAKKNLQRLDRIEKDLQQMWAIQTGMVVPECGLSESIIMVNPDLTSEIKHKDTTTPQ
jgi:hypothetical protein